MVADFGRAPILFGRMTEDTGTIGVVGSTIAFVSFTVNPLIGLGVALVVANDIAHGRGARQPVTPVIETSQGARCNEVQAKKAFRSATQSATIEGDNDWDDSPEPTWSPPPPDLSLLPIGAYKDVVPAGTIDVQQLSDPGVRQMATDQVFGLVTSGQFANIEHLVWAIFGTYKSSNNDWYPIASDFCRHCKEHFVTPTQAQKDSRITW